MCVTAEIEKSEKSNSPKCLYRILVLIQWGGHYKVFELDLNIDPLIRLWATLLVCL